MKKIIRLTESDLIRLVRRVINEQTNNGEPLSNKSEGFVLNGLLFKLPQIKDENSLDNFTLLPEDSKETMKQIFGEKSTYSVNAKKNDGMGISNQSQIQTSVLNFVYFLLMINALSGQKSPIKDIEEAKKLVAQIDFSKCKPGSWSDDIKYDLQDVALGGLSDTYGDLEYYVISTQVFNYYSRLLQSRLT